MKDYAFIYNGFCNWTDTLQLTACLNAFGSEHRSSLFGTLSYFFMYVLVSNLHFPQTKLVSEKPPEAVLEKKIFFWGSMPPDPTPLDYAMQSTPSPHPLWEFGRTSFFLVPAALS